MFLDRGFETGMKLLELFVGEFFDSDELILGLRRPDQLIQLRLHCSAVSILSVLNEKNHEERDDRRSRVDDELPVF